MRYCGNNISPDERTDGRTNAADGQRINIMHLSTLSSGERIKMSHVTTPFWEYFGILSSILGMAYLYTKFEDSTISRRLGLPET